MHAGIEPPWAAVAWLVVSSEEAPPRTSTSAADTDEKREQSDHRSHPAPLPAGRCRAGSSRRSCPPLSAGAHSIAAESVGSFGTLAAFKTKNCAFRVAGVSAIVIHLTTSRCSGQSPVGIRLRSEANALSCGVAEELNLFSAWPSGTSLGGRSQAAAGSWQARASLRPRRHGPPPATPSGGHRQFLARV